MLPALAGFALIAWIAVTDPNIPARFFIERWRDDYDIGTSVLGVFGVLAAFVALAAAAAWIAPRLFDSARSNPDGSPGAWTAVESARLIVAIVLALVLSLIVQVRFGFDFPGRYGFAKTSGSAYWIQYVFLGALPAVLTVSVLARWAVPNRWWRWKNRIGLVVYLAVLTAALGVVGLAYNGVFDLRYRAFMARSVESFESRLLGMRYEAEAAYSDGDPDKAIALYERALNRNPAHQRRHKFFKESQSCRLGLSEVFSASGRNRKAIRTAEEAIGLEPEYWRAHRALAMAYLAAGEGDRFTKAIDDALRLNPMDLEMVETLVTYYGDAARNEDVIRACRKYLHAHQSGQLRVRLNGVTMQFPFVVDGQWKRVFVPLPSFADEAERHITLQVWVQAAGERLPVWVDSLRVVRRRGMHEVWKHAAPTEQPSIEDLLLRGDGKAARQFEVDVRAEHRFFELHVNAAKPWGEILDSQYRKARLGSPHAGLE